MVESKLILQQLLVSKKAHSISILQRFCTKIKNLRQLIYIDETGIGKDVLAPRAQRNKDKLFILIEQRYQRESISLNNEQKYINALIFKVECQSLINTKIFSVAQQQKQGLRNYLFFMEKASVHKEGSLTRGVLKYIIMCICHHIPQLNLIEHLNNDYQSEFKIIMRFLKKKIYDSDCINSKLTIQTFIKKYFVNFKQLQIQLSHILSFPQMFGIIQNKIHHYFQNTFDRWSVERDHIFILNYEKQLPCQMDHLTMTFIRNKLILKLIYRHIDISYPQKEFISPYFKTLRNLKL